MIRALVILPLAFAASGCVSGDYERFDIETPPRREVIDGLVVGQSELGQCLAGFGAPLFVRELGTGAAMAWGARRDHGWNISASVPVGKGFNANLRYTTERVALRGIVCFFDADWKLVEFKEGWLEELLPIDAEDGPARPQDVDLIDPRGDA